MPIKRSDLALKQAHLVSLSFWQNLLSKVILEVHTYQISLFIGFTHASFTFAQEANIHNNKFNNYKVPSGLLILFLEKALTLIHMETHLNDVSSLKP